MHSRPLLCQRVSDAAAALQLSTPKIRACVDRSPTRSWEALSTPLLTAAASVIASAALAPRRIRQAGACQNKIYAGWRLAQSADGSPRPRVTQCKGFLDGLLGSSEEEEPEEDLQVPSWSDLATKSASMATAEELEMEDATKRGRGPLRVHSSQTRLFDAESPSEIRVEFYRDSAAWCPYCEKVQLALEEKQVPYKITKVPMNCYGDKPFSFLAKNPMGLLPVAEVDGRLITESNSILQEVDAKFQGRLKLVPPGTEREVLSMLRLERQIFGSWFTWLRSPFGDAEFRDKFLYDLREVERVLGENEGPYFLGDEFSMVECHFAPFLERMAGSLAYFKGFQMRRNEAFPNVERWFAAMESRPSYAALASDYFTHAHDLPPQLGGCAPNDQNEIFRSEIDGEHSWELPLPVDVPPSPVEPLLTNTTKESEAARREAARKLIGNNEAVRKFCLRACGNPGFPPVGAPLADPRATPSGDKHLERAVDKALRSIVAHLLEANGNPVSTGSISASVIGRKEDVEKCLEYLRDRIGVPRDMSFPAARQLRAHINSYLKAAIAPVTA